MKQKAVIVDIDGTLSDAEHRRHHLDKSPKDWDSFFADMSKDKPKFFVRFLVSKLYNRNYRIILLTGRGEQYRAKTEFWLGEYEIRYDELLHRKEGDFRSDVEVKRDIYNDYIKPKFDVQLAIDDRTRIVKLWRELGLECWQVDQGDF